MLEGEPELPSDTGIPVDDEMTTLVEAPCSGLFVQAPGLRLEDRVEAGQSLGHIIREDDLSTVEITAPVGGWLWRYGSHRPDPDVKLPDQHPYSDSGDPLASIISR
jgi:predicted deacylase